MFKIDRKLAQAQNLTHYYTGAPCRHGHLSERYTSSGACSECVILRSAQHRTLVPTAVRQVEAPIVAGVIGNLVEVRLTIYPEHVQLIRDTVRAVCVARYPALSSLDLSERGRPKYAGGPSKYRFLVPREDREMLIQTASALWDARAASMPAPPTTRIAALPGAPKPELLR